MRSALNCKVLTEPSLALEGRELVLCGGWLQFVSVVSPVRLWLRSRLRRP